MQRLVLAMVLVLVSPLASATDPAPALRALRKLQTAVETGVSYKEYLAMLRDAKFEERLLSDTLDEHGGVRLLAPISEARRKFELAGVVWEQEIASTSPIIDERSDFLRDICPTSSALGRFSMEQCRNELWTLAIQQVNIAVSTIREERKLRGKTGSTP